MDRKKVFLIYNPVAGSRNFSNYLDYFLEVFQREGFQVDIHRTASEDDFYNEITERDMSLYEALIVAGGDGSINCAINAILTANVQIPLGILPAGTMNDICYNIGMPSDLKEAIDVLSSMHCEKSDVGIANDRYFLNVCGGGLFMEVSQNTDIQLKNVLGRAAYFITGLRELPVFRRLKIRITADGSIIEDYFYFFIVMNGKGAGGFHKLAPEASMYDGYFDFIGIKACPLNELSIILAKILRGTHHTSKNVIHFKCKEILIENLEEDYDIVTDMDGEEGPPMPLDLKIFPRKLEMIIPAED